MTGGRKTLIRMLVVAVAAIVTLVTYSPAPTLDSFTLTGTVPNYATVSDPVPATPFRTVLEKPVPIVRHIALRDIRANAWFPAFQDDTEQVRLAMADRVSNVPIRIASQARSALPLPPDYWRTLVETWFQPEDVETALRIIWCESGYDTNAKNPSSTASGGWQFLRGWWSGDWGLTGPFDPFDPAAATKAAAQLRYHNGSWSDWYASRHCWQ